MPNSDGSMTPSEAEQALEKAAEAIGQGKGIWKIKDEDGKTYKFQLWPEWEQGRQNNLLIHEAIRSDEPVALPGAGGLRTYPIEGLIYKWDSKVKLFKLVEDFNALGEQKNGKLKKLLLMPPEHAAIPVYCQSVVCRMINDLVDRGEPRSARLSAVFVHRIALVAPDVTQGPGGNTSFYTVDANSGAKKSTGSGGAEGILGSSEDGASGNAGGETGSTADESAGEG